MAENDGWRLVRGDEEFHGLRDGAMSDGAWSGWDT